jgi:peptidoglycan/xylan/chitin deacetylase (PgdA/CDA1 family)
MGFGLQPRIARITFPLNCLAARHLPARRDLIVLTYHRIGDSRQLGADASSLAECTPEGFAAQLAWLREYTSPVDVEAALAIITGRTRAPNRPVLITFDDGYRDDMERIRPACERHGIRPLVFLPTSFIGTARRFWWDRIAICIKRTARRELALRLEREERLPLGADAERERAVGVVTAHAKHLQPERREELLAELERALELEPTALAPTPVVLDWDETRALRSSFDFGAHTVTHPVLSSLGTDELRRELGESKATVERELERPCHTFAIPFGTATDYAPEAIRVADEVGYQAVFSLEDSLRAPAATGSCYLVDRLTLSEVPGAEGLAAKVTWPGIFVPKWSRILRERLASLRGG